MATYGNYETVGRIYSIGARSVYSARAVGGSKDEYVIKIVTADDVFGEDPAEVLRDFTERARIQQKLGEARASAWTVVHEVGQRDSEVYYVTDRAASSAQQLVAGKVRTEGADLYRVVSAVIQGLRELRAAANRAHANLKPSNVLIDRTGDVAAATVLLTDPSGAAQARPAEAEHADVRDLGDLIHQLVLHAPFRAMGGYPIEDSPNWVRLGKTGPQWRALCNRMLDPAAAPGTLTIESLAGEVDLLRARGGGGGGKKALVIGAAAAALVAAVGIAAVVVMQKPKDGPVTPQYDASLWKTWATDAQWAVPFRDELASPQRRAALEADEYLRTALLPLAGEQVELDARDATPEIRARRLQLAALAQSPPVEAGSPEGIAATTAALDWIARAEAAISAERWPVHRSLRDAESRLNEIGLARVAEFPRMLIDRLENREDGSRRATSIIEAARVGPTIERLLVALEGVQPGYDGEIMTWVANETDFIDLGGVQASVVDELSGYLEQNGERLRAVRVTGVPGGTVPGSGGVDLPGDIGQTPPGLENTETGIVVAPPEPAEELEPDPRGVWTAGAVLETVRGRLREPWAQELEGANARGVADAGADVEAIAQLVDRVGAMAWTLETRDEVRAEMARVESRLTLAQGEAERLHEAYEAQVEAFNRSESEAAAQALRAFEEFVEQFESHTPEALRSEFLLAQWNYRRGQAINQHNQPSELASLQTDAAKIERDVTTAESGIPVLGAPENGPEGYEAGVVGAYFAAQRESAIERAWHAGSADGFGPGFEGAVEAQRNELIAAADVVRRAVADMLLADAGLRSVAAWDEPLNRNSPPDTLAGLHARWVALSLPAEVVAAMGPVPGRLADAERLNRSLADVDEAPREALGVHVDLVSDSGEALIARLYTWRALRAHPGVTLPEEQEMVASLRTAIGVLPEARQAALRAELDQAARARWTAAIENASSEAEYNDARAARQAFGGNLAEVSQRTQFNLGLVGAASQLRELGPSASDDQVREVLSRIVALADRDPTVWQNDASVNAWIGSVRAALNRPSGTNVEVLAAHGPGAANWQFQAMDPGGERVRYTRSVGTDNLSLEFVRLDPGTSGLTQAVYLSTTEVSLRMFGAVASGTGAWPRIEAAWADRLVNIDDSWDGPRTWTYNPSAANRLTANRLWLSVQGGGVGGIPRPFAAAIESPSLDMPVQYITAPAARVFSELVGCRLPTSREWAAARGREGTANWNLRDAAWVAQRDYAAARQSRPPLWPFPDAGMFVPIGRDDINVEVDAQPIPGANDGVLYFQPVDTGAGATFRHIVGNVAEFVDDSPAGFGGAEESRQYRVVGGSAISPPELGTDQSLPLVTDARDNFMVPTNTYADVGFRLAFDSPQLGGGPPLAQQVAELVNRLALVARRTQ